MAANKVDEHRAQLEALAARLSEGVRGLTAEARRPTGSQAHAEGEADPGSEASEEALARTLLGTEGNLLGEVNAALDRIQTGTYGKCETCGGAISAARLEALPYARHCIKCAQ